MTEVTSVNGKTGAVVLTAADVESVPESQAGQPNGVATLDSSGQLPEAQLPPSVETSSLKALGNLSGLTPVSFAAPGVFTATLTGATELEPTGLPASPPRQYLLKVATGGHTLAIKGITWIGPEPVFGAGTYAISLLVIEGGMYGLAGLEGPEGKAGNTILFGEGAPAEGLGVSGNFYMQTVGGVPAGIYGPKAGASWGAGVSIVGKEGPKGEGGERGPTGGGSIAGLIRVAPSVINGEVHRVNTSSEEYKAAKRARFVMVVVPVEGKLKVFVRNGTAVKGNTRVGVLDTGQKAVGEYALIEQSAEVAQGEASKWQEILGGAHVYTAGQVVMIGVMNSTAEGSYGADVGGTAASNEWPEGAIGGVSVILPKLVAERTYPTFEFASVAVANMSAVGVPPSIIAHVV
jgi:hypothetical protein